MDAAWELEFLSEVKCIPAEVLYVGKNFSEFMGILLYARITEETCILGCEESNIDNVLSPLRLVILYGQSNISPTSCQP